MSTNMNIQYMQYKILYTVLHINKYLKYLIYKPRFKKKNFFK